MVALNNIADNMNKYFHRIKTKRVKELPLISQLDLVLKNELGYSSQQEFKIYNELNDVVKEESFRNDFHLAAQFKRVFYKKIFVRPRFFINRRDHLDTDLDSLRGLDNYMYRSGIDIGIMGKDTDKIVQTYFYFDYGKYHRYVTKTKENRLYLWDERIGFSKIIIASKKLSSEFNFYHTRYHSNDHDQGVVNTMKLSEVLSLNNNNYVNLSLWWSNRARRLTHKPIITRGGSLNYLFRSLNNGFKINTWGKYEKIEDNLSINDRGREVEVEWGVKLTKSFSRFFSTSFTHKINDRESDQTNFDNRHHSTIFALSAFY
jgi:hypothetical protein